MAKNSKKIKEFKIDEEWRTETDAYCTTLILERYGEVNKSTGKPVKTVRKTYHSNMKAALKAYLHKTTSECETVVGIIDKIEEVEDKIEKLEL